MKSSFLPAAQQLEQIARYGTIHAPEQLLERLRQSEKSKKPLCIKAGFDPTAPDLHLGHTVLFRLMRTFVELGHKVVFVIGDFTGLIGDPSGRDTSRPPLSVDDIAKNAQTYADQVGRILDVSRLRVEYNSSWLEELGAQGLLELTGTYTVARMLERDDFKKRFRVENSPIGVHEFMYPLMQAYDSVALEADVELGGSDQLFNLLVGRDVQRAYSQKGRYSKPPQEIVTVELLEGLDGVAKMSKSLNNHIAVEDSAEDMFGKVMSLNDEIMWRYLDLASDATPEQCEELRQKAQSGTNPRDIKLAIAGHVAGAFHSHGEVEQACQAFLSRFSAREVPKRTDYELVRLDEPLPLANVLHRLGLAKTTSEARRLIAQGAVRLDGTRVDDPTLVFDAADALITVGKRRIVRAGVLRTN